MSAGSKNILLKPILERKKLRSNAKKTSVLLLSALFVLSIFAVIPTNVSAQPVIETYVLEAVEDAYVDERGPYRDTNYGNLSWLGVGSSPDGNMRAFIKFDLSEIPYGSVRSARLVLNATKVPLGERTYEAYAVWGSWDIPSWTELNVTWNNQPWWMGDMLGSASVGGVTAQPGPVEWEVKEAVKMWINRWWPNNGIVLRDRNEWSPAKFYTSFNSSESSTLTGHPKLIVEIVVSPTFELSVYPTRMSSPPGGTTYWWLQIRSINGWSGTIDLTATGLEAFGGSVEFETNPVYLNPYADYGTSVAITAGIVKKGSYTFYINGTGGQEFSYDSSIIDIVPAPVIRTLPDSVTPSTPYSAGRILTVNMTYNAGSIEGFADGNPTGIIVRERLQWYLRFFEDPLNPHPPDVVRFDGRNATDPFDDETELIWMFAQDFRGVDLTTRFEWTYKANFTMPNDIESWRIPGELWFWGEWKATDSKGSQMQGEVLGDRNVKMEFGLPGYWDDDGRVDDFELLQAVAYWKKGGMTDAQLLAYLELWVNTVGSPGP